MSLFLRQIAAIARTEWRILCRGRGLRLVLLLIIPFILFLFAGSANITDHAITMFTFAPDFVALLAAFLIIPFPRREEQQRIAELVWVRPLSGLSYLTGKLLVALLTMAALLAELLLLAIALQLHAGSTTDLASIVTVCAIAAPPLALTAVLYLACGILLPHPFLGYLVALLSTFLFTIFFNESMIVLWNPWAISLFHNPTLGFGPDGPLLWANRLFYWGLTILCAGIILWLFGRRYARALITRTQRRATATVLACGILLIAIAIPRFQSAVAATTLSGPVHQPSPAPVTVQNYNLAMTLDPSSGLEEGTAHFTIHNDSHGPLAVLPIYMNDGLQITAAYVATHPARVANGTQFSNVTLRPALTPGASTPVILQYGGHLKLLHAMYGDIKPGLQTVFSRSVNVYSRPFHQSFIGMNTAMLFRDGDWYPLPWTLAATTHWPAPLGWQRLQLRVPASATTVASTSQSSQVGSERVFTWTLHGRLPTAILTVIPDHYTRLTVPGGVIYAPAGDTAQLRARYSPYVTALHDLTTFFGQPLRSVQVVAAPLTVDISDITSTALGGTLAVVPAYGVDSPADGYSLHTSQLPAPAPYRAALSDLAAAWWDNQLTSTGSPWNGVNQDDLSKSYVDMTDHAFNDMLSLVGYTGAIVAEARFGKTFYAQEMALRRAITRTTGYTQRDALTPRIIPLGLQGRIGSFSSDDGAPALDDLRHLIGTARLNQLLRTFSSTSAVQADDTSIACALSHATGHPMIPLMSRYLAQDGMTIVPRTGC